MSDIELLSGNKGEWSEIYTLFKLLSMGKLYAADEFLNKREDVFYDVIKIFREEDLAKLEFNYRRLFN